MIRSINCGCGCNSCDDTKVLNSWLSDAISDAGNFHLEVFDGIQRQWTGVDLIKTSFTAPWIKDAADTLTMVSHIGGAIVITYFAPALMPLLVAGGMMIGSAIKGYDTRYLEYIDKMYKAPTYNLTTDEEKQLYMIVYWALLNVRLMNPYAITDAMIMSYVDKLKTIRTYTIVSMFNEFRDYVYQHMSLQNYDLGQQAYNNNLTYAELVDTIVKLADGMTCGHTEYLGGYKRFMYAYQLLSGQYNIDKVYSDMEDFFKSNPIYTYFCGPGQSTIGKPNALSNYQDPGFTDQSNAAYGINTAATTGTVVSSTTNPPIGGGGTVQVIPPANPSGVSTTSATTSATGSNTNSNPTAYTLPPDTSTTTDAGVSPVFILMGVAMLVGGMTMKSKKVKRKIRS